MEDVEFLFDEDDRALFRSTEFDLKAKALRYHLMPRLENLFREALGLVQAIYGVDALEFSTISRSPGFRTDRRQGDVTFDYETCIVGLCGVRKPIWTKVERAKDGKPPVVLYISWRLELLKDGLFASVSTPFGIPLAPTSYDLLVAPLTASAGELAALCQFAKIDIHTSADDHRTLRTLDDRLKNVPHSAAPEIVLVSQHLQWPITNEQGMACAHMLAKLFPIYDAWLRAAQGLEVRLPALLQKLDEHIHCNRAVGTELLEEEVEQQRSQNVDISALGIERTVALPAKRYRVFQRDEWRCVSCGKDPVNHGVILHVDHIDPRSKGGVDRLENYQTLCNICNLGKSNRDNTDIRALQRGKG